MEFGPYQLQIFSSIVLILGAAFVALICDFLKGNNEQLRELTIELKIRREEERRHFQLLVDQMAQTAVESEHAEGTDSKQIGDAVESRRAASPGAPAVMDRRVAMATGELHLACEPVLEQIAVGAPSTKHNWGSLLSSSRQTHIEKIAGSEPNLLEAVVAATASSDLAKANEPPLPAGLQDGFVLSQLVQSRRRISGLVISIGVNTSREKDGALPAPVSSFIQTLLGDEDFAAQSGPDEFLLIFPNERGASAQRRLSQVAQQLWDFQLRSLGAYSILFTWGGVEVRGESIEEAIASANERMHETKRGRKVIVMDAPDEQFRKAV